MVSVSLFVIKRKAGTRLVGPFLAPLSFNYYYSFSFYVCQIAACFFGRKFQKIYYILSRGGENHGQA